ncbi:16S rRNA (cytosine(1402)-N(4))-methyltransferase [Bacillus sp. SL00103]
MFQHETVLLKETVDGLNVKKTVHMWTARCGGAGHSSYLLSQLSEKGTLIGFDQDDASLDHAREKPRVLKRNTLFIKQLPIFKRTV